MIDLAAVSDKGRMMEKLLAELAAVQKLVTEEGLGAIFRVDMDPKNYGAIQYRGKMVLEIVAADADMEKVVRAFEWVEAGGMGEGNGGMLKVTVDAGGAKHLRRSPVAGMTAAI